MLTCYCKEKYAGSQAPAFVASQSTMKQNKKRPTKWL